MSSGVRLRQDDNLNKTYNDLRKAYEEIRNKGEKGIEWRKLKLKKLRNWISDNEDKWVEALYKDFNQPKFEVILLCRSIISEIDYVLSNLDEWTKDQKRRNSYALKPGSTYVRPEPYGIVFNIIHHKNILYIGYSTLISIIAAGNFCLIRLSDVTANCKKLFMDSIKNLDRNNDGKISLSDNALCFVEREEDFDSALDLKFDKIMFTGPFEDASHIMRKAAEKVTPVCLQITSPCPAYAHSDAELDKTVRRLLWGKFFNAGQTFAAPDFVLVHSDIYDDFTSAIHGTALEFYPNATSERCPNFSKLTSVEHFEYIESKIKELDGEMILEGYKDKNENYIGPTIMSCSSLNSKIMNKEIFGPVLILIKVNSIDSAINHINNNYRGSLALYVFTDSDESVVERFTNETQSGSIVVNNCTFQTTSPEVPLGGVGGTGFGQYHSIEGFREFSHFKPVVRSKLSFDLQIKYPPYHAGNLEILKRYY